MRLLLLVGLLLPACAGSPVEPASGPAVHVLGTAQDAGLPHIGCACANCTRARDSGTPARVSCLGIEGRSGWWMLDATPDLPAQIHAMGELPRAIFLTHAHIGHYTGLMYLGREALGADGVEVWASPRMGRFLVENGPWSQLVELGQIRLRRWESGRAVPLEEGLQLTAIPVPHRDEFSDTHAFLIESAAGGSVLYLPDIDQWPRWERAIEDFLQPGARLFVDATFWSAAELPHRDLSEIPHPLVQDTLARLRGPLAESEASVHLIHLNHSNPLWNRRGPEAAAVRAAGFALATTGERLPF